MTEKVCPRCGSLYEDLKSTTCPQCFAKLVEIDADTASEFKQARAEVERTPEFQEAKVADDERFREQTFGACVAVIAIAIITLVVAVILITAAARRNHRSARQAGAGIVRPSSAVFALVDSPVPTAAASIDDLLPKTVGSHARVESDSAITLPGTVIPVFHGAYRSGTRNALTDVYVISTGTTTAEQSIFLTGVAVASQRGANPSGYPRIIFATQHWRYAIIGPSPGSESDIVQFQHALASHFQGLDR